NTERLYNLKQRVRLRQHLRRLTLEETFEYLGHRLGVVGGDVERIFERSALVKVYEATRGTPRLMNTLCDTAMTATAVRDLGVVTPDCIAEVLEELGWDCRNTSDRSSTVSVPANLPTLTVYSRGQFVDQIQCAIPVTTIGRVNSNHLQIDDPSISRRHAIVSFEKDHFSVEDLGSKNGTFYNGRACDTRRYILHSG